MDRDHKHEKEKMEEKMEQDKEKHKLKGTEEHGLDPNLTESTGLWWSW